MNTYRSNETYSFLFQDFVEIFMSGGIHGFRNPEQESFMRFVYIFLIQWIRFTMFQYDPKIDGTYNTSHMMKRK